MYITSILLSGGRLLLGQAPKPRDDLSLLIPLKINYVCVLLSSAELREDFPTLLDDYRKIGLQVIHFPIEDYSIPKNLKEFEKLISLLASLLKMHKTVLMHCRGGIGRTGLTASCVLIRMVRRMTAERAISFLRQKIPFAVETPAQIRFVIRFERMDKR